MASFSRCAARRRRLLTHWGPAEPWEHLRWLDRPQGRSSLAPPGAELQVCTLGDTPRNRGRCAGCRCKELRPGPTARRLSLTLQSPTLHPSRPGHLASPAPSSVSDELMTEGDHSPQARSARGRGPERGVVTRQREGKDAVQ